MRVLLLSGGTDSACALALDPPQAALTFDYGQVPAEGEIRAAAALANHFAVTHEVVRVPLAWTGSGLLAASKQSPLSATPEWWPFRNQILVTLAASWAIQNGFTDVEVASVSGDGSRHADGTALFFTTLNQLLQTQEGGISVRAPYLEVDPAELVRRSSLGREILGWCHSCHRAPYPCGTCPGCIKQTLVLTEVFGD